MKRNLIPNQSMNSSREKEASVGICCRGVANPEQRRVKMKVAITKLRRARHMTEVHEKLGNPLIASA
jgi:hypothetical protein